MFYRGVLPKPQVVLAPAAWGGAAMRRPSLHGAGEFVSATWEMINGNFFECGWSADGTEIVVRNPERLAENVLPRYFRHTQYSSWVRTLNHYSFRKTRPGQWVNPHFQRDKPELLHYITRKVGIARPVLGGEAIEAVRRKLEDHKTNVGWMRQEMGRLEAELRGVHAENTYLNTFEARLTSLLQTDATACMSNLDDRLDTGRRQGAEMQSRRSEMEVSNIARDAVSRRSVGDWLDETKVRPRHPNLNPNSNPNLTRPRLDHGTLTPTLTLTLT